MAETLNNRSSIDLRRFVPLLGNGLQPSQQADPKEGKAAPGIDQDQGCILYTSDAADDN